MTMPLKSLTNPVVYCGNQKKYGSPYLFIWQQPGFVTNLNSGKNIDEKLKNKIVKFLTGNKCIRFTDCYGPIKNWKNFIYKQNVIFGISPDSKIDFKDIQSHLSSKDWHVITDGGILKNYMQNFSDFYNFYGIIFDNETRPRFSLANENICRDL